jgi:hypothetical protein
LPFILNKLKKITAFRKIERLLIILEITMQKIDVAPDWFLEILIAWGAWASGSPVNLKPRTFWQMGGGRDYLVTRDEIDRAEKAVLGLRSTNFPLAAMLEYKYKTPIQRTFLEIEKHFHISNAQARQYVLAAECSVFAIYSVFRDAA